jgi:hypothetical protein
LLSLAVVADGFACRVDAATESGLGNNAAAPDRFEQFILTDHAVTMSD